MELDLKKINLKKNNCFFYSSNFIFYWNYNDDNKIHTFYL
ncbi:MAG: hypothetical protein NT02SARS_1073 [SAR86 cluster bacterium SAR86B]|uniref:Uncharacterized protein n=1 Tax=SAR86 cluster bacterium SAR86B TaxID=1123867 RepID=J4V2A8_9GAMM|nr:MAG: hypothetical protein NT02SARS_1073 [SAR86 cluster bacterium SAR86B]